jgi:hypothetical protein
MAKKISHPYPHAGTVLSLHADAARPYPLSISLHLSLTGSRRPAWPSTASRRSGSLCRSTRRLWSLRHRRPAAVLKLVPVWEPPRDAGEGRGRRGRGGPACRRRRRMGLREGGLRRLLQEDLPLLQEMEESLRCVSPLLDRC